MEKIIEFDSIEKIISLFGEYDKNINALSNEFGVSIISRGESVRISGSEDSVSMAAEAVRNLMMLIDSGEVLNDQNVAYAIQSVRDGIDPAQLYGSDCVCITAKGKPVKSKTLGQKSYVEAIRKNTITFGIGPAGTGKTYLAVAMAVKAFKNKEVTRIILTRPAVEAGEKLGFLPGDLQNKVDPYLRPLYDALYEMLGMENS